jgi:hypothetical protein
MPPRMLWTALIDNVTFEYHGIQFAARFNSNGVLMNVWYGINSHWLWPAVQECNKLGKK